MDPDIREELRHTPGQHWPRRHRISRCRAQESSGIFGRQTDRQTDRQASSQALRCCTVWRSNEALPILASVNLRVRCDSSNRVSKRGEMCDLPMSTDFSAVDHRLFEECNALKRAPSRQLSHYLFVTIAQLWMSFISCAFAR
jgi:hypothetical protein